MNAPPSGAGRKEGDAAVTPTRTVTPGSARAGRETRRAQTLSHGRMDRRTFLATGAAAGAAGLLTQVLAQGAPPAVVKRTPPNFLLIISDQMNLDAVSAAGCPWARTPNIDRLAARGVMFMESHSTNPVCSPARSSLMTGRMPVETGVISNTRPIHSSRPTLGTWFRSHGYDTVYCGKWHLPGGYPHRIRGFEVLSVRGGQGDLVDPLAARACQGWLWNRSSDKPFLMVASFLQPHDICYWSIRHQELVPEHNPFRKTIDALPDLPPNLRIRPREPERLRKVGAPPFTDEQWRYYRYIYYRQVEMADAAVGHVLDALEARGLAENTIVVFTADHGEGGGRHNHVQKWYPYEEAVKVPLIVSCPGRIPEGIVDRSHLVSGLDLMRTFCDFAGAPAPPGVHGRSLRPLLEGRRVEWREFVAAEMQFIGRMIRTDRFKYVRYKGDPVEQLFDMHKDPWETKNLFDDARYADVLKAHRRLLEEWEKRMDVVKPTPVAGG